MEKTGKKGLPPRPTLLRAQERLNNTAALPDRQQLRGKKMKNKTAVELPEISRVSDTVNRWWTDLETHYEKLGNEKHGFVRRDHLCALAGGDCLVSGKKYCRMPSYPPHLTTWEGEQASKGEFTAFLSLYTGLSEGVLKNTVFDDRKRPKRETVQQLCDAFSLPEGERQPFFGRFGYYPQNPGTWKAEREAVMKQLQKTYPRRNDEQRGALLGLSKNSPSNARTIMEHSQGLGFHFVILLGKAEDLEGNRRLYRAFGLEPLPEGEADGVAEVCHQHRGDLLEEMRGDPENRGKSREQTEESACREFWILLKALLRHCDSRTSRNICGQIFYSGSSEVYDVILPEKPAAQKEGK